MKNFLLIALLLIVAYSCTTQKRCNRLYPPVESSQVRDSIVAETITVYKDTTIYVPMDPDTVTLIAYQYYSDPQNPELITIDTLFAENEYSHAWAWVNQSQLGLSLARKDTAVEFHLDDAVRETWNWQKLYHSEFKREVKYVKYIPKFYRFCLWYFLVTATAMIILLIVKLKKFLPF